MKRTALSILIVLAGICRCAAADVVECQANGVNSAAIVYTPGPTTSTNSTCSSIKCKYLNNSSTDDYAVSCQPTLGSAGGFYEVFTKFNDFASYYASSDNIDGITLSGAVGVSGDMLSGTTTKWQHAYTGCTYRSQGIIKLDPGVNNPRVRWGKISGTVTADGGKRWYVWGIEFVQRTDISTVTVSPSPSAGGTVSQSGPAYGSDTAQYVQGTPCTVSAASNPGYVFWKWRDGSGSDVSTDNPYTFEVPSSNITLSAVFVANGAWVHAIGNPSGVGTIAGEGVYTVGSTCTLTATAGPGYSLDKWTANQAGSNLLSTNNPYSFTVNGETTVYAQFVANSYILTRSASAGGTVSGDSGSHRTGEQVTVTATPNPGYWFAGWTARQWGDTVVSRSPVYTFSMPASDCDLAANFSRPELVETFESYGTGGASYDSLDKNDPSGPNQASNGNGNPWWGTFPPNGRVNSTRPHGGSKSMWGTAGGCRDFINIQSRCGSGTAFGGSVYLDWWFYDPLGSAGTSTDFCNDYAALSYTTGIPGDTDYASPLPDSLPTPGQQLAIGMSDDFASGYDSSKYQVRIAGDSGGYHNGWFNTAVTRSVGWHHARVMVGPRKSPSNTNDVAFYVDDMQNPIMPPRDSVGSMGYNLIEIDTIMPKAGSCDGSSGCTYSKRVHYSAFDDLSFGSVPVSPGAGASTGVGTGWITWHWTDNSADEDGFRLRDGAGGTKASVAANVTGCLETGLDPNTRCSRWVEAFTTRYAGTIAAPATALPITCTLAVPPAYDTFGDGAILCNNGPGSASAHHSLGAPTVFTAVNGFGEGPDRAGKYQYFWNTSSSDPADWNGASQWTSGALTQTPSSGGSYYLHLRACNVDGVANPAALTLGPYVYDAPSAVAKISDAWAYDDSVLLSLAGKPVTAAYAGNSFWIEESNRSAGMRVAWTSTTAALQDHLVNIAGYLDSSQKPRTLVATSVEDLGAAPHAVAPLMMTLRELGGSAFNAKTPGAAGRTGLYNVGLLVRVVGRVSFADNTTDPSNKLFYVDDGSVLAANGGHPGVKVRCGAAEAPTSGMVRVTGVVSLEPTANGYAPVLILRSPADVEGVQ